MTSGEPVDCAVVAGTVREHLLARAGDGGPGLLFEESAWTWAQVVHESCVRSSLLRELLPAGQPPHVGVLLDNTPEFAFLLGAAALGGHVVVGLNTTRGPAGLAADIARSDTQLVLTDGGYAGVLGDADVPVMLVDSSDWTRGLAEHDAGGVPDADVDADSLMMLIFTSGTSGEPKAVRITHSKVAGPGYFLADRFEIGSSDVVYQAMPLFHSNAIMAGWALGVASGAAVALARRFSASGFLPDVRRYGATYANYVGKPLTYVMATPEQPDDADNPLRVVFGNEANERDIAGFARRFGCAVVDSYGSTENAVVVQRTPDMPVGALGRPVDGVAVLDPATSLETEDAKFDADGTLLNAETAIGELVNTTGAGAFAGYYRDEDAEAERMRGGMYWSGDLAYRDSAGFVYFAGRTADWLRVDGENLAAAPIERVLLRHPAVSEAAVYAVPDPSVGDQVMAALVLSGSLEPDELEEFLRRQADLSTKGWPRYVRIVPPDAGLPRTPTNKVLKRELAAQGPVPGDGVLWVREERGTSYACLGAASEG
jgi:fatty-acyl-CoA synthase